MAPLHQILLIEDSRSVGSAVLRHLESHSFPAELSLVTDLAGFQPAFKRGDWDLVLVAHKLLRLDFEKILEALRTDIEQLPLVLLVQPADEAWAVQELSRGVWDYLVTDNLTRLVPALERALKDSQNRREQRRKEMASRKREIRYRALFDEAVDGILLMRDDGTDLQVNASFARMHGYDHPREMEPLRLENLLTPETARLAPERRQRAARGENLTCEVEHYRKDGSTFWMSVTVTRLQLEDTWHLLAFHRDITEQRRNHRLQALAVEVLGILNDPQALPDATKRILEAIKRQTELDAVGIRLRQGNDFPYAASEGFSRNFLQTENSLVARTAEGEFCLDAKGDVCLECTCGLVLSGKVVSGHPLFTAGGSAWTNDARPFLRVPAEDDPRVHPRNLCIHEGFQSVALIPIRLAQEIIGLLQLNDRRKGYFTLEMIQYFEGLASSLGVALQRLKEEETLLRSRNTLRSLFDAIPQSLFLVNLKGEILEANSGFAQRFGKTVKECVGQPLLRLVPEHLVEVRQKWMAEVVNTRKPVINEELWGTRWLRHNYCPVFGTTGEVERIVVLAVDITERKLAEEAVREREQRFRSLVESSPVAMGFVTRDGAITFLNQRFTQLFGYNREDLVTLTDWWRLAYPDPDYRRKIIAIWTAVAERDPRFHQKDTPREWRVTCKDGSIRTVQVASMQLAEGVLASFTDLTERKRAEEEIRHQGSLINCLIDSIPDLIFFKDLQGFYLGCNPSFAEFAGCPKEDIVGKRDDDLFTKEIADFFRQDDRQMLESLAPHHNEEWITYPDGRRKLIETLKTPYLGPKGELLGVLGISRDITERRRAEEQLTRMSRMLAEAQRIAHLGSFEYNADSQTTIWSEEEYRIYGLDPNGPSPSYEEMMARHIHPEDAELLHRTFTDALRTGSLYELEHRIVRPDGTVRFVYDRAYPSRDRHGKLLGYVGATLDVTERKRLESELRQAQKLEAIGQLAGGIAHDFNNILAAIEMQLSLLEMKPDLDEETQLGLTDVHEGARRAATLTRQLLMFSRRSVLDVKALDLGEIVENLLKMLHRLIGENIQLSFARKDSMHQVEADAGMLEQVVMNLVVNARDAMPKGGGISIITSVANFTGEDYAQAPERREGTFVCLAVKDEGCGMDAETLKRIFEPFFTTKEPGKGTGLGLATVHGIVAQHNGWVEVDSDVGKGTTFHVFLPESPKAMAEKTMEDYRTQLHRGREVILVVEDERNVRRTLVQGLRMLGYQIYEAENGQQAMRLWQKHSTEIDLLLTDMVMPEGMTGLELAQRLRAMKPTLHVIISSGYSSEVFQTGGIKQAGIQYLPKPYEINLLSETIRSCLTPKGNSTAR